MGLRTKLIIALLLVFGALGFVIITTIQSRVMKSYDAIEFQAAQADMARLIEVLDDSIRQLDDSLLEWATWTELYDFMQSGEPKFRATNISPESIPQAKYSWLGIYDVQGRMLAHIGRDPDSRKPLSLPELEDSSTPLALALKNPLAVGVVDCGLISIQKQIYAMCRRAISDSRGVLAPRGVVVMLKLIGPGYVSRVVKQTKLDFRLSAPENLDDQACRLCTSFIHSGIGDGRAHVQHSSDTYEFRWNLQDVLGNNISTLSMTWTRSISQQGRRTIDESAILFAIIVGCGALLMLLIIDRLVVLRIRNLAVSLHDICNLRNWGLRTSDSRRDEIGELSDRTNDLLSVIEQQVEELEDNSRTDPLTGLSNRRHLDEQLPKLMRQHQRSTQPLSLIVIDVDCFKDYNDHYGHAQGDAALRIVADCLRQSARRSVDLPVRIGGEEFVVVLPDSTMQNACVIAERFRETLHSRQVEHAFSQAGPYLSASLGVSTMRPDDSPEEFFTRADLAMYRAKGLGRDRVETASDD
ncbi:diguanylate cyclase [Uliginosibacterium sp. 31-16]|uniref:sensor domain-containing diguanylate cyclase n=1 Tax=Uliginosibacterium sp. 31-16 TaxID=3068315 RepID=UPI00273E8089|nr:diguanylate cyclase [Uliginosibacterium sp. 31-16]MDP5238011.1 diguanylate cyclase [Uliginosibacterium sp. 31-16]